MEYENVASRVVVHIASFLGPTYPREKGLVSIDLCMCVIINAKTDGEEHMMFPICMLDDVTYCTRTKL